MSDPKAAKLYEPPVYCAKRGCKKRLTIAAVGGGSKHCSRQCAGFLVATEKPGYKYGSGDDPTDSELRKAMAE